MVSLKFAFRKSKNSLKRTISLLPLIIIGTAFFIVLFTIVKGYESATLQYFEDYHYSDYTLYGEFTDKTINDLEMADMQAEGRYVNNYKNSDKTIRAISITNDINLLYLYEGTLDIKQDDCLMLNRNAKALGKAIGDRFEINGKLYNIAGLVESTEYIYLVKDEKSVMNEADKLIVTYLNQSNFSGNYNEVIIKSEKAINIDYLLSLTKAKLVLTQEEQINYTLFQSDLNEISSFAYIFPVLFLIIIMVIIFVILKRTIALEKKSIAAMKALGTKHSKITLIYLTQFVVISITGVIIGCLTGMLLTDLIIKLFSNMFIVPTLSFVFYPSIWLIAIFVLLGATLLSGIVGLLEVFKLEPAEAIRPSDKTKNKEVFVEKTALWEKLSFNTRYALKNILRNKVRFFAACLAISISLSLLILSSGFMDSITNTKNAYFEEAVSYNLIVETELTPYSLDSEIIKYCGEDYFKVLQITEKIHNDQVPIKMVDQKFNMINLPITIQDGLVIPTYYADKWNVKVGEKLQIGDISYRISDIIDQYVGLTIYTSYDYIKSVNKNFISVYNCIYVDNQPSNLISYLDQEKISYTSLVEEASMFNNISESVKILTSLMTICAVILGIFALYSIGIINLSSREQEYAQLNALGYSEKKILLTQFKEIVLQFIVALPFGIIFGNLLLIFIKGEFSNQSFCLKPIIYPSTYCISIAVIIILLALIIFTSLRQIKKINIVEKLKWME